MRWIRWGSGGPRARHRTGSVGSRPRRDGFILLAALWLLVALAAVGLDAALRSRARRLTAANALDETRARAAATAGVEYARSRLTAAMLDRAEELRSQAMEQATSARARSRASSASVSRLFRTVNPVDDPWRDPSQLIQPDMAFGAARYTLRVRDTGSALNLNTATEDMLRQFFAQGLSVDYALADRLAQAILDWRDEDDLPRVGGGERDQYLAAGMAILPPNRDFADVDELRHVLGMTDELYRAALPYLTVVGSGNINVNAAPEPVLLAIPGMTVSAAQQLVRLRTAGTMPRNLQELEAFVPGLATSVEAQQQLFSRVATFATNEVEIRSEGRAEGSPIHAVTTVVVTRSNAGAVVVWRRME